ncbi:MAG: Mut7-C RNAse domain-containing protein [Burkholderiaceae bacterium]
MTEATFRFHGALNDFLARERRQRDFRSGCARAATTKHMIEALGVPHTEVSSVQVNGRDAGLDRLIADGDRIEVFPHADRCPDQDAPPRFVADAHLGGLARLLRMAGFDTLYDNHFEDGDIARIAAQDGRIVLTRDRDLLKRREVARGCYPRSLHAPDQLRELWRRYGLGRTSHPFTLCLHCNAPLRPVDKAEVLDRLPPTVRRMQDTFSTCDVCHRIYWQGSHWRRMSDAIRELGGAA